MSTDRGSVWKIPGLMERFDALMLDKHTAKHIAETLSVEFKAHVTRSMVTGHAFRLGRTIGIGKPRPARPLTPQRKSVLEARRAPRRAKEKAWSNGVEAIKVVLPLSQEPVQGPEPGSVPIDPAHHGACAVLALSSATCRFPMGDPLTAQFRFCCSPVSESDRKKGYCYCPVHQARAFVPRNQTGGYAGAYKDHLTRKENPR